MRRFVLACLFLLFPATALAGDGVLEINQTCATQTGCFAGDAAGFPVTISASGSYRLTSNLDTTPNVNVTGISVAEDDVTIDLNGFTVAGPVTCVGEGSSVICSSYGIGSGILAAAARVTIRNGRVRGFGDVGIFIANRGRISNVTVESNSAHGIHVGPGSIVSEATSHQNQNKGIITGDASVIERCVASANKYGGITAGSGSSATGNSAYENGGVGISTTTGGVVIHNSVSLNGASGIEAGLGSLISDNAVFQNGQFGLALGADAAYRGNAINGNTFTVLGGVSAGGNVCNGSLTCP